jgi:L-aminopeptidase/D-esterase-like protein
MKSILLLDIGNQHINIGVVDGDALFVLATGFVQDGDVTAIGHAASEVVAAAIVRGVKAATGLGGVPAARDLEKGLFG